MHVTSRFKALYCQHDRPSLDPDGGPHRPLQIPLIKDPVQPRNNPCRASAVGHPALFPVPVDSSDPPCHVRRAMSVIFDPSKQFVVFRRLPKMGKFRRRCNVKEAVQAFGQRISTAERLISSSSLRDASVERPLGPLVSGRHHKPPGVVRPMRPCRPKRRWLSTPSRLCH